VDLPVPPDAARLAARELAARMAGFVPDPRSAADPLAQRGAFLARALQHRAAALQTPGERRQQAELDRLIQSPSDRATLVQMTDQAFRARLPHRAADQLLHLLDVQGIPRFFTALERSLLRGFQSFGAYLPGVAMPLVRERMQHETANVVLPAEEDLLRSHLLARRDEGVRMNVNVLGEALLGEREAQSRLEAYLQTLARPEIEVISVKISTIHAQISTLARTATVGVLADRLELLYRAALRNRFVRSDGSEAPKFVYLDMEEYRDKEITAAAFMAALSRPGMERASAGIALQAYLPDSFATQREITAWAVDRVARGGAPITIRLVKGANLEMERVEASLRGWPLAAFAEKIDTDANFLRMLRYGLEADRIRAVHLGIASHNLFTLAYGLVLADACQALDRVQFEMLEGMASHQRRALFEVARNLLLYGPACRQEDFVSAIGYLVRRLDENTGQDNFLRHAFRLQVDDEAWQKLRRDFLASFERIDALSALPRRTQNRSLGIGDIPPPPQCRLLADDPPFHSAPDTDWSLPHHSAWAADLLDRWRPRCQEQAPCVPLAIDGAQIDGRTLRNSIDPSRPAVVVARYAVGDAAEVAQAVAAARADRDGWRRTPADRRAALLRRVAEEIESCRGDLLGAMLAETGKLLAEGDPEVSEAVDFCRFYGAATRPLARLPGVAARGRGAVVVASPWNFPLAIPCGGVAAALAAGNNVILKPASDAVLVAWRLCECFWRAGVPPTALQFLPCPGATTGRQLAAHPDVDAVILTGGSATARELLAHRPAIRLSAETGGKNATIVTALADRDLAVKHVVQSAFGHSGQKCSATSLLILEQEVFDDRRFRAALCDAVESLAVGSAWELTTRVGPLIRPPGGPLERALKELEPGETWAVMPRLHVDGNPHLVGPGVKWDVQPGSFTHRTELFGPVLAVMAARDLHHAIDLANATGYGLTSGLESLDEREHLFWQEGVRAGNLYINRPTTGATVLRQPFGGMGQSAVGPGIQAGGPNYVVPLMEFDESEEPPHGESAGEAEPAWPELAALCRAVDVPRLSRAAASYAQWAEAEFLAEHDHFELLGEDNFRRYLPFDAVRVRVDADDRAFDIAARAIAARTVGCRITVSVPPGLSGPAADQVRRLDELTDAWAGGIEFVEETDGELAAAMRSGQTDRVRYARPSRVPAEIRAAAAETLQYVADAPVSAHGRLELLWYVQEQSLTRVYHRYGNLGLRGDQVRAPLL